MLRLWNWPVPLPQNRGGHHDVNGDVFCGGGIDGHEVCHALRVKLQRLAHAEVAIEVLGVEERTALFIPLFDIVLANRAVTDVTSAGRVDHEDVVVRVGFLALAEALEEGASGVGGEA